MYQTLGIISYQQSGSYDADAQAYFDAVATAGGTLSTSDKNAYNTAFLAYKSAGLYSVIYRWWPMSGGNSASSVINAVSPGTGDFINNGSPTCNANGITYNGVNQFSQTDVTSAGLFTSTTGYMELNVGTNSNAGNPYDFSASALGFGTGGATGIVSRYNTDLAYALFGTGSYAISVASTNSIGVWGTLREGSTTKLIKNGTTVASGNDFVALNGYIFYIGCNNGGNFPELFSDKNMRGALVTNGFDTAAVVTSQSIQSTLQNSLGRPI